MDFVGWISCDVTFSCGAAVQCCRNIWPRMALRECSCAYPEVRASRQIWHQFWRSHSRAKVRPMTKYSIHTISYCMFERCGITDLLSRRHMHQDPPTKSHTRMYHHRINVTSKLHTVILTITGSKSTQRNPKVPILRLLSQTATSTRTHPASQRVA